MKINVDAIRNPLEVRAHKALQARAREGKYKVTYEEESIPYVLEREYVPDFIIEFKSGHKRYIEVKGWLRPEDTKKMIAIRRQYPDMDIRIFFDKDNKMSRNSKMRYSDWSKKYGFQCCFGHIPDDWFRE